jgi:hypothetical protein
MEIDSSRCKAHRDEVDPPRTDLSGQATDLSSLGHVKRADGVDPLASLAHRSDLNYRTDAVDQRQDVDFPPAHDEISS